MSQNLKKPPPFSIIRVKLANPERTLGLAEQGGWETYSDKQG